MAPSAPLRERPSRPLHAARAVPRAQQHPVAASAARFQTGEVGELGRAGATGTSRAAVDDPQPRPPGLTVAAVAHRLGVAPATLRTWARRYGLGPSAHEAGSHRRYTSDDLARLVVMRRLTLEGVPPVDAARAALTVPAGQLAAPAGERRGDGSGTHPADDPGHPDHPGHPDRVVATVTHLSASLAPRHATVHRPRTAPGRRPAGPPWGQEFDRAAVSLDPDDARRLVEAAFAEHGVVDGWEQLVGPAMRALAQRWETTGPGVDSVLMLTGAVLTALRLRPVPAQRTSALVLLAAAQDERDALVLHVLAAALAERGVPSRVLAPGRPREALAAAVRSTGPAAVLVVASAPVGDAAQLAVLPRLRPAGRLVLAGPGWQGVALPPGFAPQVVAGLGPAVDAVTDRALV